ncbi:hypothetical protein [Paraburkholderia sp. PGU19]|uniref:hypothetical protein n=1 Tax=Paraburkholderia sp. PGU19 TaxID=2735434 RepID=UPI001FB13629|nr:hypothetical protein [Paraburkholderia sp. PGU19]
MSRRSRLANWRSARSAQTTRETAQSFGLLATMMKVAGRNPRPRNNDLWIAAQAHEHRLPLLTSNSDDFRALDVIEVIEAPKAAH